MKAGVILVAAGSGDRFGRPKAFVELDGQTLLARSAARFDGFFAKIAVLRLPDLDQTRLPGWTLVAGGARRRDSVAAGLAALPPEVDLVLIHDAARPLVSDEVIARVREAAEQRGAAIPVLAVTDTLKRTDGDVVAGTVDRAGLVAVQTPQGFSRELLERALAASERDATDEAGLVEDLGETVCTVPGDPANVKVTVPADLAVARAYLHAIR